MDQKIRCSNISADLSEETSEHSSFHSAQSSSGKDPRFSPKKLPDPQAPFMWRGVNLVMAVFLALASYVQINDPDPYIWVPVYLIPSLLSLGIVIRPSVAVESAIWRCLCLAHLVLCVAGALCLLSVVMELLSKEPSSFLVYEEIREFIGVIIVVVWLSICRFSSFSCMPRVDSNKVFISVSLAVTCLLGSFPLVLWSMCFFGPLRDKLDHCNEMQTAHHHHQL